MAVCVSNDRRSATNEISTVGTDFSEKGIENIISHQDGTSVSSFVSLCGSLSCRSRCYRSMPRGKEEMNVRKSKSRFLARLVRQALQRALAFAPSYAAKL